MRVDLKLLITKPTVPNHVFAPTVLEFGSRHDLFDKLDEIAVPLPHLKLNSYFACVPDGAMQGEPCYGQVTETPYGKPLTYVTARQFQHVLDGFNLDQEQRAVLQYVQALDGDTLIALYYH